VLWKKILCNITVQCTVSSCSPQGRDFLENPSVKICDFAAFPPETGTLLSALQTFFAPQTGTPSSLRDTPSNRGNHLTGELPFRGAESPKNFSASSLGGIYLSVFASPPRNFAFCTLHFALKKHPAGCFFYSVLSASTGSFLAARDEGTRPAMKVRNTLMPISSAAAFAGS